MTTWILKTNNFKTTELFAEVIICKKKIIFWLSLKKLFLFWAIGAACIFVPVLHFILVPTFLTIGMIVFWSQYKNTHYLKTGSYVCPICDNRVLISGLYLYDHKKINCEVCMEHLTLIAPALPTV